MNGQVEKEQIPQRKFLGIWTPAEIWMHPNLSRGAKTLWAEIHSLHDNEEGGCWASNEYLAKFMGVKERAMQEMLSELKKEGLLSTRSNGRRMIRRALLPVESVQVRGAENCTPGMQKTAPLPTPLYKEEKKEENKERLAVPGGTVEPEAGSTVSNKNLNLGKGRGKGKKKKEGGVYGNPHKRDWSGSVELEVSNRLLTRLRVNNANLRLPKLNEWASEIDRMIRIDKREVEEIKEMIDWVFDHSPFWAGNILSPGKLRKQFDALMAQRLAHKKKTEWPEVNRRFAKEVKEFIDQERPENCMYVVIEGDCILSKISKTKVYFNKNPIDFEREVLQMLKLKRNIEKNE